MDMVIRAVQAPDLLPDPVDGSCISGRRGRGEETAVDLQGAFDVSLQLVDQAERIPGLDSSVTKGLRVVLLQEVIVAETDRGSGTLRGELQLFPVLGDALPTEAVLPVVKRRPGAPPSAGTILSCSRVLRTMTTTSRLFMRWIVALMT
jgi:hypothetical protein